MESEMSDDKHKHTPAPWDYIQARTLTHIETRHDNPTGAGVPICSMARNKTADAAFIVRAVNEHAVIADLKQQLAEVRAERDEAVADARRIAETNLHAQAYIDGQAFAAGVLRVRVETLEQIARDARLFCLGAYAGTKLLKDLETALAGKE
jgi:hypothetical protein